MRRHLWVLLAYLVLSLLLTWPLVANFGSAVPGDGIDDPALAWNLWWVKHATVDQPQSPFTSRWIFWPVGINLAFYTLTVLNGLLSVPLQLSVGLVPSYNILLLSSFALGGYGAFLLCRQVIGDGGQRDAARFAPQAFLACFLGGALYAFASSKMFYAALGQGNIASSQWAPFAALYIWRAARAEARPRDALLGGLYLVLQAYAEQTFASFLLVFLALVAVWTVWRFAGSNWAVLRASLLRFALLGSVFVLGLIPMLAAMLPDLRTEADLFSAGGGFADLFSADLAGYALPTQLHPVLGDIIRRVANDSAPFADGGHFPVNKGQHVFLGYSALALAACGLVSDRRRAATRFWALAALLFFLLTLGPGLRVGGRDLGIPLPFALVAQLPFFEGNRYPSRYSVMLLLCLAPLVAAGFVWLAARRRLVVVFPLALGLLLFEHLSAPLPLFDLRVPPLYAHVAQQPGDFALLEVPTGWRNGARVVGKQDILIMQELWYQSAHEKRLLGGNTSRNSEFKFQYFSEDPTLARLIAWTNAADVPQHTALRSHLFEAQVTDAEARRAQDWAAFLNIRYVMVHRDSLPADSESMLRKLLPLTPVAEDGNLALYEISAERARPREFAVGTDAGRMALAEGWSPPAPGNSLLMSNDSQEGPGEAAAAPAVWAQSDEARLLLPLEAATTRLNFYGWAAAPNQQVTVIVDGHALPPVPFATTPGWLSLEIPGDRARPPLSDVRLRFSSFVPVPQVVSERAGAEDGGIPVSVLVRSAGQETGDFGHVYVDGIDRSPGGRGYNLVALDPASGGVLSAAVFDTHADAAAGAAMAVWINDLPQGTVVAGAVKDEASMSLSAEAVDALHSLGVVTDLRGHFRWGHAFIGTVGSERGSAAEAADGIRPAQISSGLPVSSPEVAAALVRVTVGAE